MARDDEGAVALETDVVAEAAADTATEAPAEATVEAPATQTPAEPEKQGPTPEEIEQALTAFYMIADGAVGTHDASTGEVPEAEQAKVKGAYGSLPTTQAKTKARNELEARMKNALAKELNAAKARAYMILGETVKSAGAREAIARVPVDPTQAFVERVAAMYLAPNLVSKPDEVDEDWVQKVQNLGASLQGEVATYKQYLTEKETWDAQEQHPEGDEGPKEPEVSEVVRQAARIARGRAAGVRRAKATASGGGGTATSVAYTGPRRNVKAHISQVFADKAVGTFLKVSEIAKAQSDEYGSDRPSQGAVTAALKSSKFDVAGIVPANEGGVSGARKTS